MSVSVYSNTTLTSRQPWTRHVTSLSPTGTGTRYVMWLTSVGVQYLLCDYPSTSFYLHRFNPLFLFRRRGFFSSRWPYSSLSHFDTFPTVYRVSWGVWLTWWDRTWVDEDSKCWDVCGEDERWCWGRGCEEVSTKRLWCVDGWSELSPDFLKRFTRGHFSVFFSKPAFL